MKRKRKKPYIKISEEDIRTLCYSCARDYYNSPDFYIKVILPRGDKDSCAKCYIKKGFDYIVKDISKENPK